MKISKKNIGTDGYNFEIKIDCDINKIKDTKLINENGIEYGLVSAGGRGIDLFLNLPQFINSNNLEPFKISDAIMLDMIKSDLDNQLKSIFGSKELETKIKSIEVNLTQPIDKSIYISDILSLITNACHTSNNASNRYCIPDNSNSCTSKIINASWTRDKYYMLKCYNKSISELNLLKGYGKGKNKDKYKNMSLIEKQNRIREIKESNTELLRIEIKLLNRTLEKLYGCKLDVNSILTKSSLTIAINEYRRIMDKEIINGKIKPYLDRCVKELVEGLCELGSVAELLKSRKREIIFDKEVLRKAIKKWQRIYAIEDTSRKYIHDIYKRNKIRLPIGVLSTIKDFHLPMIIK